MSTFLARPTHEAKSIFCGSANEQSNNLTYSQSLNRCMHNSKLAQIYSVIVGLLEMLKINIRLKIEPNTVWSKLNFPNYKISPNIITVRAPNTKIIMHNDLSFNMHCG